MVIITLPENVKLTSWLSDFLKVYSCADGQSDSIVKDIEDMVRSYIEKVLVVYPSHDPRIFVLQSLVTY